MLYERRQQNGINRMTNFRVWVVRRLEAYFFNPHFTEEDSHESYDFEKSNKTQDSIKRTYQLDLLTSSHDRRLPLLLGETQLNV